MRAVTEWIRRVVRRKRIVRATAEVDAEQVVKETVVVGVASVGPGRILQQIERVDPAIAIQVLSELSVRSIRVTGPDNSNGDWSAMVTWFRS